MPKAKTPFKPFNIWVCNRADGATTFGEYIRAKRNVFLTVKHEMSLGSLAVCMTQHWLRNKRPFHFMGDPLPSGWFSTISGMVHPIPCTQRSNPQFDERTRDWQDIAQGYKEGASQ